MIAEKMEGVTNSCLYLRHIAPALWKTDGVSDMLSEKVQAQARISVAVQHDEQKTRLEGNFDS